jgi:hypothetical protein
MSLIKCVYKYNFCMLSFALLFRLMNVWMRVQRSCFLLCPLDYCPFRELYNERMCLCVCLSSFWFLWMRSVNWNAVCLIKSIQLLSVNHKLYGPHQSGNILLRVLKYRTTSFIISMITITTTMCRIDSTQ